MDGLSVAIVKNPYTGNYPLGVDFSEGPSLLETGGLRERLAALGCSVKRVSSAELTGEENQQRGCWNRLGLALGHIRDLVSANQQEGLFTIGLWASCNSLTGMLAGLQHSAGRQPRKVGLVWLDAHGDYNTPETSMSGLLGGMPVAVAAGHCLSRLRLRAGLDPPLPTRYIVMGGLRHVYPYERELMDRSQLEFLSTEDLTTLSPAIDAQMERLSRLTDIIYVHVDQDILNPDEVPGFNFPEPGGPTSRELAAGLRTMFRHEKAAAFGVASTPYKNDTDGRARNAAYCLIEGAVQGVLDRMHRGADPGGPVASREGART
jgi:arginase